MKQRKQTTNLRITTRVIAVLITIAMIMGNAFYGGGTEVSEVSASTDTDTSYINYEEVYTLYHTCTIKQKNGKWYYVNSKGKINKKKGWKKDQSGKLTYYVGKNGYVKYKIEGYTLYKWNGKKFKKVSISSKKIYGIKKIAGKYFYINNWKGYAEIDRTMGWKEKGSDDGLMGYYVNSAGYVQYNIKYSSSVPSYDSTNLTYDPLKEITLYKWKNGKWKKVSWKKIGTYKKNSSYWKVTIGDRVIKIGHKTWKWSKIKITDAYLETLAYEAIFCVNEERLAAGLWRLVVLDEYMEASQIRAKELTASYSHTRPDGSDFATAYTEDIGGTDICWGENNGISSSNARGTVKGMMQDSGVPTKGHRKAIESRVTTGVSVRYTIDSDGVWYCNMLFFGNDNLLCDILEEEAEKRGVDEDDVTTEIVKDVNAYNKKYYD